MALGEVRSIPRSPTGRLLKRPRAEPIPGYRLIAPLGKGGFGEVWKCEAPGGIFKALKFVSGNLNGQAQDRVHAEQELKALERIKDIRHPFVLSLDRVEIICGELVIVMELADESLQDLLTECQTAGLPGIPRPELQAYLCEAAEALDLMNVQYGLQHLDIKPRNLFLVSKHVKVADFGLVNTFQTGEDGVCLGGITPLYAAPETFAGVVSSTSDQYSLAIVYQELLTGTLPFRGRTARQLALLHTQSEPDLSQLPEGDQPIVAKALAKNPQERFPSCLDFLQALISGKLSEEEANRPTKRFQVGASALVKRLHLMPEVAGASTLSSFVTPRPPLHGTSSSSLPTPPAEGATAPALDINATGDALAGYRYLLRLHSGPLGELWKVETPSGQPRMLKIVYGFESLDARYENEAIVRLVSVHHPVLMPIEILQREPGRLVLGMELIEETLHGRLQRCQVQGMAGIPRDELLDHLREAAETLDELYDHFAIQHLALNPRNLLLHHGGVWIGDFGLAQLLLLPAGKSIPALNPRYTASELFDQQLSKSADQYSLALIYQELLTGVHPFRGRSMRQMSSQGGQVPPDLDSLTGPDRAVVARALADNPNDRFPTCIAFIEALEKAGKPTETASAAETLPRVLSGPLESSLVVTELVSNAAGPWQMNQFRYMRYLLHPGEGLLHRCGAHLRSGILQCKIEGFCQEWNARIVDGDQHGYKMVVSLEQSFWQRCLGKQPGLEVTVKLEDPKVASTSLSEVTVRIRPVGCNREQGERMLREVAPMLLDSLRASLQANPERRVRQRLRYERSLRVSPIFINNQQGSAIEGKAKDLSVTGMGLYLPHEPPTNELCLHVPNAAKGETVAVAAKVVRVQPCGDGWYEIGARFLLDDPLHVAGQGPNLSK